MNPSCDSFNGAYVLLSACKNEQKDIRGCLESIGKQSLAPLAWVIVDDGSTDQTVAIIKEYLAKLPFLKLIELPHGRPRSFGSKDRAIQIAYRTVESLPFSFVGILDTDIGLESEQYFSLLFEEFGRNPKLGVGGGVVMERENGQFKERPVNVPWSVAGCVQMFRRTCYDSTGGFIPLEYGGSDTLMELQLRKAGWETRSFPHLRVYHYRPTSSAGGLLRGWYRAGLLAGSFGSYSPFVYLKAFRRLAYRPYLLGGLAYALGFTLYRIKGRPLLVPQDISEFLRQEQRSRLLGFSRFSTDLQQSSALRTT